MSSSDSRIPVVFATLADARPGDGVLLPAGALPPAGTAHAHIDVSTSAHPPGCACCVRRSGAAAALGALYLARARGSVTFFSRLVAALDAAGEAEVRRALAEDVFVAARYRTADPPSDAAGCPASGSD